MLRAHHRIQRCGINTHGVPLIAVHDATFLELGFVGRDV